MKDFIDMFKRRRNESLLIALLVLLIGSIITFKLPPSFRSTATIIVENTEASSEEFGRAVTGYADRRIRLISKRVLTSETLSSIAETFDLLPSTSFKDDGRLTTSALIQMRKRISIDLIKVKAVDPKTRFPVESAIAFDISFTSNSAESAQLVTQYIADLFLSQSQSGDIKVATKSPDVAQEHLALLKNNVDDAENKLKDLRASSIYTLPDMKESNLRMMEKIETELTDTRLRLRAQSDQKVYLESELIRLKPYAIAYDSEGQRILGAEDQLKALQTELASKRAKYSHLHPDILRLKGEISNLENVTRSDTSSIGFLTAELSELNLKKAEFEETYSSSHPSLIDIKQQISALQKALQAEQRAPSRSRNVQDADNPAYISTAAELKSIKLGIQEQKSRINKLENKYEEYKQRLEVAPSVERKYNELTRQHQQALEEYQALSKRNFTSDLSGSLVQSRQEQELSLLEPANLPEAPFKPNRKLLLLVTGLLSVLSAIGMTLFRERLDDRIWTSNDILAGMNEAPLASIPEFEVTKPMQLVFLSDILKSEQRKDRNHA